MKTKYCILFAGVPGSSKSPMAHHLSWNLGLPFFNNDVLRTEVKEDLLEFNQTEYERRRDERIKTLVIHGQPFIYDASIDRAWEDRGRYLDEAGYEYFIISLDLSSELLNKIYEAKGYREFAELELRQPEHDAFLQKYGYLVNLHITDKEFPQRLNMSLDAVRNWLNS